jgi:hypothetical protein
MICPPFGLSRPDRYCRLLPPFHYVGDRDDVEDRLLELALSMFPEEGTKKAMPPEAEMAAGEAEALPAAAYTYFGQFIMHDLTFDDTPFRAAGRHEPAETVNYRTPRLDLDSVYGNGPGSDTHGHLYDGDRFLIGTTAFSPLTGVPFDVPLARNKPAVADPRNCENAIVRQIHAMFLLLHNLVVDNLRRTNPPPTNIFDTARSHVRWIFQRLVRHDFLPNVCKDEVYQAVIGGSRLIHWPWGHFSIPVEFSQAVSRFGHSMVRKNYLLREQSALVDLEVLLDSARGKGALKEELAVDWLRFTSFQFQAADFIDTYLASFLSKLTDASIHPFVNSPMPHEPHMLALRTLCRGARTGLPTGQQMRVAVAPNAILRAPLETEPALKKLKLLKELGFESETPLWYYTLLEAEINENGRRLGIVGSRIVAEVIEACLQHDLKSFFYRPRGEWEDKTWTDENGAPHTITTLLHLAWAVGLFKPPKSP